MKIQNIILGVLLSVWMNFIQNSVAHTASEPRDPTCTPGSLSMNPRVINHVIKRVKFYQEKCVYRSVVEMANELEIPTRVVSRELNLFGIDLKTEWERPRDDATQLARNLKTTHPGLDDLDDGNLISFSQLIDMCKKSGLSIEEISHEIGSSLDAIENHLIRTHQMSRYGKHSRWDRPVLIGNESRRAKDWLPVLIQNYSPSEIAERLQSAGISDANVRSKLIRMGLWEPSPQPLAIPDVILPRYGLVKKSGKLVPINAIKFISDHLSTDDDTQLAATLGMSQWGVRNFRYRHQIYRPTEQSVDIRVTRGISAGHKQELLANIYFDAKKQGVFVPFYQLTSSPRPWHPKFRSALQDSILERSVDLIKTASGHIPDFKSLLEISEDAFPTDARLFGIHTGVSKREGIFKDRYHFVRRLYPRLKKQKLLTTFNPLRLRMDTAPPSHYRAFLKREVLRILISDYLHPATKTQPTGYISVDFERWFGGDSLLPNRGKVYDEEKTVDGFVIFSGAEDFYTELQAAWNKIFIGKPEQFRVSVLTAEFHGTFSEPFRALRRVEFLKRVTAYLEEKYQAGEALSLEHTEITLDKLFPRYEILFGQVDYKVGSRYESRAVFSGRAEALLLIQAHWNSYASTFDEAEARGRILAFRTYNHLLKRGEFTEAWVKAMQQDAVEMYIYQVELKIQGGERNLIHLKIPDYRLINHKLPVKDRLLGKKQYALGNPLAATAIFESQRAFGIALRQAWLQVHGTDEFRIAFDEAYN